MAKRVRGVVKLQIAAGRANPAPPVGTALGPHGINIMDFCKAYNERTQSQAGQIIPALIHDLRGSFVHVRAEDAAGLGPAAQGGGGGEGRG